MKIYLQRFLGDAMPLIPLSGLYFLSLGFSLQQISTLFLFYAIFVAVLEVPTGYLADRTNHRTVLVCAKALKFLAFIPWVFYPSFAGVVFGYVLWAVASALDSGAFQSYLADIAPSGEFRKSYGRALGASLVAFVLGATSYVFVPYVGFKFLGIVGLAMLLCAFLISLNLPRVTEMLVQDDEKDSSSVSQKILFTPKYFALFAIILVGAFAGGIKGTLDEYSGMLIVSALPVLGAGISMGFLEIIKAVGAFVAHRIPLSVQSQKYILLLLVGAFALVTVVPGYIMVILLSLVLLIDGILWVHNDEAIQKYAPRHLRATTASLKSLLTEGVAIVFLTTTALFVFEDVELVYLLGAGFLLLGFVAVVLLGFFPRKSVR